MKNQLIKISTNHLILTLSLIAGLFTWRVMDIRNDWINVDSVLYLDSAKAILQGDWHRAYEIYNWPFYSALIALVAKISGLEVLNAAKILNIIFFSITTFSLAKIIEQIRADKLTLLCFALLLFGSKYISGSILPMLLRDEGFWACLSTATLFLIRFLSHKKIADAFLWQVFIMLATLFRIEGAIYLITLPLVVFWQESNKKIAVIDFLKLNGLFVLGITGALLILPFLDISAENIGRLNEIRPESTFGAITGRFRESAGAIQPILGVFLMEYAQLALATSLLTISITKMLNAVSLPILLIIISYLGNSAIQKKTLMPTPIRLVLFAIIVTVSMTSAASILRSFVLSGRYLIPLAFVSMIVASVMLADMLKQYGVIKPTQKVLLTLIIAYFGMQLGKNIWTKPAGYNYEKVAIDYLQQKQISLDDVTILSPKAAFYAQRKPIDIYANCSALAKWDCVSTYLTNHEQTTGYILLPLIADKKAAQAYSFLQEKLPNYSISQEFNNPKKDKKLILLKKDPS